MVGSRGEAVDPMEDTGHAAPTRGDRRPARVRPVRERPRGGLRHGRGAGLAPVLRPVREHLRSLLVAGPLRGSRAPAARPGPRRRQARAPRRPRRGDRARRSGRRRGRWTPPGRRRSSCHPPSGPQVVLSATPIVAAYDPATGAEIWRADVLHGEVAPTPICRDGVVYVAHEDVGLFAIRTDGTGDVTEDARLVERPGRRARRREPALRRRARLHAHLERDAHLRPRRLGRGGLGARARGGRTTPRPRWPDDVLYLTSMAGVTTTIDARRRVRGSSGATPSARASSRAWRSVTVGSTCAGRTTSSRSEKRDRRPRPPTSASSIASSSRRGAREAPSSRSCRACRPSSATCPEDALRRVCEITDITPADIVGVATFYDQFRFEPMGRNVLRVCHGTACHVKGAAGPPERDRRPPGHPRRARTPTRTGRYTVQKVACLGLLHARPRRPVRARDVRACSRRRASPGCSRTSSARRPGRPRRRFDGLAATGTVQGEIRVGLGSCCVVKGTPRPPRRTAGRGRRDVGLDVAVRRVGCVVRLLPHAGRRGDRARAGEPGTYDAVAPDDAGRHRAR